MDKGTQEPGRIRVTQHESAHRERIGRDEGRPGQPERAGHPAPVGIAESTQEVERLSSFAQLNPIPILETDSQGRVTYCNPAATSLVERLGGDASPEILLPPGMDEILDALRRGKKALFNREVKLNSLIFSEKIYAAPEFQSVRIYAFDITDRVRAEEMLRDRDREIESRIQQRTEELRASNDTLRAERQKLYALLEELPAIVCLVAPDLTLSFTNRRFRELFGDPRGHRCFKVIASRNEPCKTCHLLSVLKARTPVEWQWNSPEGRIYQLYDYPFAEPEGSPMVLKLGIDITERRRAEEALRESERQLRSLSAQLLQVQEAERARVSRELHDELGQALTIMKLRLSTIRKRLRKDQGPLGDDCDDTLRYIDRIIEDVRRLSRDLSPRVLDDLGLVAALRRLVHEFGKHSRTEISAQIDDVNRLLSKDAEMILYRIVQEALTNIGKHAGAGRASLTIVRSDGDVRCAIEDNGKGFDPALTSLAGSSEEGMGMAIMKERIRMLGGYLDLQSQPGQGTRLSFSIPIAGREAR